MGSERLDCFWGTEEGTPLERVSGSHTFHPLQRHAKNGFGIPESDSFATVVCGFVSVLCFGTLITRRDWRGLPTGYARMVGRFLLWWATKKAGLDLLLRDVMRRCALRIGHAGQLRDRRWPTPSHRSHGFFCIPIPTTASSVSEDTRLSFIHV